MAIRWRCEVLEDEPTRQEAFGAKRGEEDGERVEEEDDESEEREPEPGEVELILRVNGVGAEAKRRREDKGESVLFELAFNGKSEAKRLDEVEETCGCLRESEKKRFKKTGR